MCSSDLAVARTGGFCRWLAGQSHLRLIYTPAAPAAPWRLPRMSSLNPMPDAVVPIRAQGLQQVEVGRNSVVASTGLRDSSMLTQDENIVDGPLSLGDLKRGKVRREWKKL